uniref:CASTOR ACT domain-containing protein n=1 Tax=Moniliophthora roreri TaxID=221103 RepID=A0A0W0GAN8_MONRR
MTRTANLAADPGLEIDISGRETKRSEEEMRGQGDRAVAPLFMQTLQLLPVSLVLVSIPRCRVQNLSSHIIRQILQPSPAKFLNISSNEIELSIFAEAHTLSEFEHIARRDRQKHRSRSGSGSSRKNGHENRSDFTPVEVSYERWSVLQKRENADNSGARVNELSAPLAMAGISILYQSSYMSDFIFVKECRLREVLALFSDAGFDLYSIDDNSLSSSTIPISPPLSPYPQNEDETASMLDMSPATSKVALGSVLTRTRSTPDTPSVLSSRLRTASDPSPHKSGTSEHLEKTPSKQKSHSPTSGGEVHVLDSDLTCVGLADDSVDQWSLKIIKLVAFPDLIPSRERDGSISYYTPASSLRPARPGYSSSALSDHSSSSPSEDEGDLEDGYFSHSPNQSTSSLVTSITSESDDLGNIPDSLHVKSGSFSSTMSSRRSYSKHLMGIGGPLSPLSPIHPAYDITSFTPTPGSTGVPDPFALAFGRRSSRSKYQTPRVPFFSFTRTPEGSSLTTDAELLATLFPPSERYMVICGGELDAADQILADGGQEPESMEEDDDEESGSDGGSMLKCLQIDLRKFGLDKYGLVNRFSRVLDENKINHMYSSTFKTANLLVEKRYAVRALTLLRNC